MQEFRPAQYNAKYGNNDYYVNDELIWCSCYKITPTPVAPIAPSKAAINKRWARLCPLTR